MTCMSGRGLGRRFQYYTFANHVISGQFVSIFDSISVAPSGFLLGRVGVSKLILSDPSFSYRV